MTDEKAGGEDPQSRIQSPEEAGFIPLPMRQPRFRRRPKDSEEPEDGETPPKRPLTSVRTGPAAITCLTSP